MLAMDNVSDDTHGPLPPSDIHLLRKEAEQIEKAIDGLEFQLAQLKDRLAAIQGHLSVTVYPVSTLPAEILCNIFASAVSSSLGGEITRALLLITSVCQRWRHVAIADPIQKLWTNTCYFVKNVDSDVPLQFDKSLLSKLFRELPQRFHHLRRRHHLRKLLMERGQRDLMHRLCVKPLQPWILPSRGGAAFEHPRRVPGQIDRLPPEVSRHARRRADTMRRRQPDDDQRVDLVFAQMLLEAGADEARVDVLDEDGLGFERGGGGERDDAFGVHIFHLVRSCRRPRLSQHLSISRHRRDRASGRDAAAGDDVP
ncbi:hypothetical protein MIND_00801900 [Mycena indigotica]|uniref:F-box domain-containing protein n=1 Tax=Mycena indigotica TaxID=2126181 RepID=A0A8H6SGN3_9AGAR|nr:uncharacterized protein MIND_00801900 [Mycena indigotica]KAF7298552.1 hypothetical protein MIND_00801900 [Mycena indigotica]